MSVSDDGGLAGRPKELAPEAVHAMYGAYWNNMSRSMEGVWQLLGPITVAGTILAAVHKAYIPQWLGMSLALLIIHWGITIIIDLNDWHRRNLFFVAAVEREMLRPSDYGRILPTAYRSPRSGWIEFYRINLIVLITFGILVWVYAIAILYGEELLGPFLVTTVGGWFTYVYARAQETKAKERRRELFGAELSRASGEEPN